MPHVWEKKYTPLNTEHMGEGREPREREREGEGERQAPQEVDGPSPQPALKEALLPGVLNKRRKSYNQRGGDGVEGEELSHLYTTL